MSVDKLVDSAQLDADLTTVANAIRTKGGTSASLVFPAGFVSAIQNLPSGGGLPLLATLDVGSINSTSTSATDLGKSITVSGINAYDLLLVVTSVNTVVNNRHQATARLIWLTASSAIGTKDGASIANATWNVKVSSSGVKSSRASNTAYGVYPNSCTVSSGSATIPMYRRYNSSNTGTLNGTYTARVYGVKVYDLLGG